MLVPVCWYRADVYKLCTLCTLNEHTENASKGTQRVLVLFLGDIFISIPQQWSGKNNFFKGTASQSDRHNCHLLHHYYESYLLCMKTGASSPGLHFIDFHEESRSKACTIFGSAKVKHRLVPKFAPFVKSQGLVSNVT